MSKRIGLLCGLGLWSVLIAQPLEPSVPIEKVVDRWAPVPDEPVLIPPPKILWWGEASPLILPADQKVLLEIEDESYRPAAEALARELARYGLTATIALGEWQRARGIFLGGSRTLQRRFPVPDRPGAYMLKVEPPRVLLIGRFAEGVFYGVQTLMQLLQPAPNRLWIAPLTIIDYPDMLFRGVHLFGGTQPEFHRRLIGNLVGHLKFNKLVVECGYSQWEAIKPAWVEFSVPKANLREMVALAQANSLEPIPLLQSLGHMYWVFRNNANVELAEDPETPWAICPRREASKQLLQRLFDEVLEIFPRRAFHLGLDEITLRGRFPYSPECQGATIAQLFSEHFRWLVGELQARGVREIMLWSDMLLSREEAHDGAANAADSEAARFTRQQVLNAIREVSRTEGRDGNALTLSLCDWHYTPTEHYRSLEVLRRAGFQRLIATTWYDPRNIYTFAQAARRQRIEGLLQSTWAGYSLTEKSLRDAPEQFIAYVLAAIYAWNSNAPPPEQLPFDVERFFHERYWRETVPLQPQPGFLVDLRPLYNLRLSELEPVALSRIPIGRVRLRGHLFQLADLPESPNALMLSSTKAPGEPSRYPREVVIPLAQLEQVKTLYLLHATGWQAERNAEVARLVLEYADGTQAELPLLYGVHVRAWNDPGAAIESPPIWSQLNPDGQRVRLRLLRWHNPHPGKTIRALRLSTTHPAAGYMLLGLSGNP
jgi:hypothetical protein